MQSCYATKSKSSIPIQIITPNGFNAWSAQQSVRTRNWLIVNGFNKKSSGHLAIPKPDGSLERLIFIDKTAETIWSVAELGNHLPKGVYHLVHSWTQQEADLAAIGWGLGAYRFGRYRRSPKAQSKLLLDQNYNKKEIQRIVETTWLTRDLINTPPGDMMPQHLATQISTLAQRYNAEFRQIVGENLLHENYPAIYSVGCASKHLPRLLDLQWGDRNNPKVTIIGKGVCFDSGGLNLKLGNSMRLMKKDMGGGAHAIALANLIMDAGLKVRLRLLVPSVENVVDGGAYRPGDVIETRSGLTVEIDNTDAEGRVILCDTLTEACAESPDLIIDFATLTGAARVAVGTEIACMFCNDDDLANAFITQSLYEDDPIWRLPLHQPYQHLIESGVADISNSAPTGYGGAITAALYLEKFVKPKIPWVHFDIMAWNLRHRAGRPQGGEAMALRATYALLKKRYG